MTEKIQKKLDESVQKTSKRINNIEDVSDYISKNVLDIEVISDMSKKPKNFKLTLSTGSPAIIFDVGEAKIKGIWGLKEARVIVDKEKADEFFEYLKELWELNQ